MCFFLSAEKRIEKKVFCPIVGLPLYAAESHRISFAFFTPSLSSPLPDFSSWHSCSEGIFRRNLWLPSIDLHCSYVNTSCHLFNKETQLSGGREWARVCVCCCCCGAILSLVECCRRTATEPCEVSIAASLSLSAVVLGDLQFFASRSQFQLLLLLSFQFSRALYRLTLSHEAFRLLTHFPFCFPLRYAVPFYFEYAASAEPMSRFSSSIPRPLRSMFVELSVERRFSRHIFLRSRASVPPSLFWNFIFRARLPRMAGQRSGGTIAFSSHRFSNT